MKKTHSIEVFRTGTHTDSAGREKTWTEADLDTIVRLYNEQSEHKAPHVIGHPKDNSPAYGWVDSLKRVGDRLVASTSEFAQEFIDAVKAGQFKKRSISLYPDMRLKHVGWLGATPPAVKGLADVAFAENDDVMTYEFSDRWQWQSLRDLLSGLRDFFIEDKGIEVADKLLPRWHIDNLMPPPEPATDSYTEHLHHNHNEDHAMTLEELQAKNAELTAQLQTERAERERLAAEQRRATHQSFLESDPIRQRIPAARRPALVEIFTVLESQQPISYAEGEGSDASVTKPPVQALREFLESLPTAVEFSEVAKGARAAELNKDPDAERAKAIAEIANKNRKA